MRGDRLGLDRQDRHLRWRHLELLLTTTTRCRDNRAHDYPKKALSPHTSSDARISNDRSMSLPLES
jgi:hypothetical protein